MLNDICFLSYLWVCDLRTGSEIMPVSEINDQDFLKYGHKSSRNLIRASEEVSVIRPFTK